MRTTTRIGLVGALSAAFVLGTAGTVMAKEVSAKKYAKTVCAVYHGIPVALDGYRNAYNGISTTAPVALQAEVVALTNDLVDDLGQLQTRLKKVSPDVDDGKRITKVFVNDVQEVIDATQDALDDYESADPNGVAFAADQATFEAAITVLNTKTLTDPFTKVDDQDLIKAFDQKACADIVIVTRGG